MINPTRPDTAELRRLAAERLEKISFESEALSLLHKHEDTAYKWAEERAIFAAIQREPDERGFYTVTVADVPALPLVEALEQAERRIAELEQLDHIADQQRKACISRAITGEGEPNRYKSIPEMLIDQKREDIADLEKQLAETRAAYTALQASELASLGARKKLEADIAELQQQADTGNRYKELFSTIMDAANDCADTKEFTDQELSQVDAFLKVYAKQKAEIAELHRQLAGEQWVKVSERLPAIGEVVLMPWCGGVVAVTYAGDRKFAFENWCKIESKYWRPLPAAPQE